MPKMTDRGLRVRSVHVPQFILAAGLCLALAEGGSGPLARERGRSASDPSLLRYASQADSARLPDGRTIHMVCMGSGSPVVVLMAGANDWSIVWNKVQPAVARKTRVCAWDRAGFGLSTPSEQRQTVESRTDDLQSALRARGIAGPYVLAAHSMGGHESLLFKDRDPDKVVGMVLVDPAFPESFGNLARVAPAFTEWVLRYSAPEVPRFEACASNLRAGLVGYGKPDVAGCTRLPLPQDLPPRLRDAVSGAQIGNNPRTLAAWYDIQIAYHTSSFVDHDGKATINPQRQYGDMPLVVLTAGEDGTPPSDTPEAVRVELPQMAAEWRRAHAALAALSERGVNRVVADSAHYIHQTKPQIVIEAINEVVDAARAKGR